MSVDAEAAALDEEFEAGAAPALDNTSPVTAWGRLRALVLSKGSSSGFLSLVDQGLVSVCSFSTSIILGRSQIERLGIYSLVMTVVMLMRNIQSELVTAPFSVYSHRRSGRRLAVYAGSVFLHQLLLCILGVVAVLCGTEVVRRLGGPPELVSTMPLMTLALPPLLLVNFVRYYCFARMRFLTVALLDGLLATTQVGGLFYLWHAGSLTVGSALLTMACSSGIVTLVWWLLRDEPFEIHLRASWLHWWRNWRFARWALASQVLGCSTPYIIPWYVSYHAGEGATGAFAACVTTMGLSATFVVAVANLLTPRSAAVYAREGLSGLRRVLGKTLLVYVAVVGAFAGFVLLTGDFLVVLFYGTDFSGTGLVCLLLALSILANSLSIVAGNGVWALDRPAWNLPGDAATLVSTLIAANHFVPRHQVVGAALATLIGTIVGAVVRGAVLFREMERAAARGPSR